jgi:hypothetical protein
MTNRIIKVAGGVNVKSKTWTAWRAARHAANRLLYKVAIDPKWAPRCELTGERGRLYLHPLTENAAFERSAIDNDLLKRNAAGHWEFGRDITDITYNYSKGDSRVVTANEEIAYIAMCAALNDRYSEVFFFVAYERTLGASPSLAGVLPGQNRYAA